MRGGVRLFNARPGVIQGMEKNMKTSMAFRIQGLRLSEL